MEANRATKKAPSRGRNSGRPGGPSTSLADQHRAGPHETQHTLADVPKHLSGLAVAGLTVTLYEKRQTRGLLHATAFYPRINRPSQPLHEHPGPALSE